ncbi:hypothetical protein ACFHW2_11660 [Actinomadura sp. LOL_016]|uniref:hypothetical protein n=1 Tax=unclassified Actinomadura TaxID=2626254 RepID=UPI003A8065BB
MDEKRPEWAIRLHREREARAWSKWEMARQLYRAAGINAGNGGKPVRNLARQVSWWEAGKHFPETWSKAYSTAFGIPEHVLFEGASAGRMTRRGALALAGAAAALMPRLSDGPVDPALVDYFRLQLAGHYGADMMLGPRALIGTVRAQTELIDELLERADGSTRRKLAEVGTAYGQFLGWLHLDAGDARGATHWHAQALQFAHRSGNRDAVACTLVDMAMAHTDRGAGRAVVDLCGNVLQDAAGLNPEVGVFALQQQAHGASLLGDRRLADESLAAAEVLVGRVDEEQWGTACRRTPGYVEVQRATCYGRLGLHDEADRLWRQLIPKDPGTARRDVGVWTARHATVRALAKDPDHAVELAARAAGLAVATGSARAVRELGALERAMEPWKDAAVGRDLAEVLAPAKEM